VAGSFETLLERVAGVQAEENGVDPFGSMSELKRAWNVRG